MRRVRRKKWYRKFNVFKKRRFFRKKKRRYFRRKIATYIGPPKPLLYITEKFNKKMTWYGTFGLGEAKPTIPKRTLVDFIGQVDVTNVKTHATQYSRCMIRRIRLYFDTFSMQGAYYYIRAKPPKDRVRNCCENEPCDLCLVEIREAISIKRYHGEKVGLNEWEVYILENTLDPDGVRRILLYTTNSNASNIDMGSSDPSLYLQAWPTIKLKRNLRKKIVVNMRAKSTIETDWIGTKDWNTCVNGMECPFSIKNWKLFFAPVITETQPAQENKLNAERYELIARCKVYVDYVLSGLINDAY